MVRLYLSNNCLLVSLNSAHNDGGFLCSKHQATNSLVFRRLVQDTGANFVNFRKFWLVYLVMFILVLKLISCVPIFLIFLTLLNKSFNYAFTIINALLVHAYKIYSRSVSPDSF